MRETKREGNCLCQTVLQALDFQDVIDRHIVKRGFAIFKSTANTSSCNSVGDIKKHRVCTGEYGKVHECNKTSNDTFFKYTPKFRVLY